MKTDIILAGVGGQGILSIAAIVGAAALGKGWNLKQAETHGMSQRGGAVMSHLRISDQPISSDLIPLGGADVILSVEPMESLRYLPWLSSGGWLVTNSTVFDNIPNYPDINAITEEILKLPHAVLLDADTIARDLGNARGSNMVMLGAAAPFLGLEREEITGAIGMIFRRKGEEIVRANIAAFDAGYAHSSNRAAR
ncbi:MAG: indolepyruvate oxidoreductase subunit beta [Prolixibacteraceae bacterium]|jgi:indolepyruvate ferredoxin oxidoreductase beta subunit|nr:indolepyruvate oxidoreductase subunit beta [Prolixibacteraceae bacterium]MDI9563796.1 indolepyruvate oxidoreductase subunit beta [Bacteroidota bacterium]NLS99985.1 indolepyruvate oxidoreductase subunit beta [Bacteroidales bacterium]OQB81623.1 MAG: NADH-dependent phenylglyoxylate dehydrogenase subunit gamma [Bacteroidetes bacterium ADurb.Bin123]HNU79027.1 indolepyruvate oxidoreductase subunit beta [Prolixibacteraceae bacterium]